MGVGIRVADNRDTGRKLLGALPSDVRKTHKTESIRARMTTDPVLDTSSSSRQDQPGTRTHSSELLETVEVRRWGGRRERRNNSCALHSGAPDQHHILLVHINRDDVVEAEARATLVREWLADALSGEVRTHPGTITAPSSLI
jgi:anionic cell wall polymer biosynthesis LytR-Cps2A-Psr (LCP) family protein